MLGLDAGSDDYMVKPFALQELNARLRALVRRSRGRPRPSWSMASCCSIRRHSRSPIEASRSG